jgi:hypothetical protein
VLGTRSSRTLLLLSTLLLAPASAQTTPLPTTTVEPNIYPPALPLRKGPRPPGLAFRVLGEVALPGPLPGTAPRLSGDEIEVATEGGVARVTPVAGASATVVPAVEEEPAREPSPWVASADGRWRFRTLPEGRLLAEKRSRFSDSGFKEKWSLRISGATPAPPLVLDQRVCVASLTNMVICVRADNGHRVWATDIEDRVSRPLAVWEGEITVPAEGTTPERTVHERLILVVPDAGEKLVALDPYDGSKRASFELPAASGKLVSEPVVTPAGTVAVPRQGYQASEAAVTLLAVVVAPKQPPKASKDVPYNDAPKGR